jgi:hypothetical protein
MPSRVLLEQPRTRGQEVERRVEHAAHLELRQVRAQAVVRAVTEDRQVLLVAVDVEASGRREGVSPEHDC